MLNIDKYSFFSKYKAFIIKCLKALLCGICLICFQINAIGQLKQSEDGGIENTEIVIEKNKKIVFPEVQRKFDKIPLPQKKNNLDPKEYNYKELKATVSDLDTKIKISTIKEELGAKKNINYIKGGLGNYLTTYLEGQILMKNSGKYQLGLHARHFGSVLGPVKNSLTSSNMIEAHGQYFFKKSTLLANASYNRSVVNYYGYDHILKGKSNDDSKFQDSIRQIYQQFAIQTELNQVDSLAKLKYNAKANFYNFSNRFKNSENELALSGNVNYEIDKLSKIYISSNISASNYADSTASLSRFLFNIRPEYERLLLDYKLKLKGGLNIAYENDTNSTTKRLHVYPVINAEYQALSKLIVYAGIDGDMEKNLYRTFIAQNPYVGLNPTLLHTNKQYELYGGLKGNIISTLYFKSTLSYNSYQNLSLFVNNSNDNSKFDIYYDNGSVLKLKTELTYQPSQNFQIGLRGTYFDYKLDKQKQAWHRPALDVTAFASYNIFDKIRISSEIYYLGGLRAINYKTGSEINLNDIVDINITTNYKINDRFSVFLYFYNILSQNYQRYNQYQAKGITAMGGLTFTF